MNVDAILKKKGRRVITMRPDSPLTTVIRRMRLERIGAVILSDDGESIAGILSERDVVNGLVERGAGLLDCKAADIMTHEVITCAPSTTLTRMNFQALSKARALWRGVWMRSASGSMPSCSWATRR